MVRTFDELIGILKKWIGNNTGDDAIQDLEDFFDTAGAYADTEDWKKKYEENDASWRKKYIDRFSGKQDDPDPVDPEDPEEPKKFEDLFEEED